MHIDDDSYKLFKGFAQTNNNMMPRNFPPVNSTVKLRHQAIAFVTAESSTPVESEPKLSDEAEFVPAEDSGEEGLDDGDEHLDESTTQTNIVVDPDMEISEGAIAHMNIRSSAEMTGQDTDGTSSSVDRDAQRSEAASKAALPFFADTTGDPKLSAKAKSRKPAWRDPSPAPSDSSEEVVLFHGRNKPRVVDDPIQSQPKKPAVVKELPKPQAAKSSTPEPARAQPHVADSLLAALEAAPTSSQTSAAPPALGWAAKTSKMDKQINHDAMWAPAPAGSWWKKGKPRPDLEPSPAEQAMLDVIPPKPSKVAFAEPEPIEKVAVETLASLQADWKYALREKKAAKQSLREANEVDRIDLKSSKSNRRRKRGMRKDNRQMRHPINSDDDDAADEAAYDDYMANLVAQVDGSDSGGDAGSVSKDPHAFVSTANNSAPSLDVPIRDPEIAKKVQRLAEIYRVQRQEPGRSGNQPEKLQNAEARIQNVAMLGAELPEELRLMAERESYAEEQRIEERRSQSKQSRSVEPPPFIVKDEESADDDEVMNEEAVKHEEVANGDAEVDGDEVMEEEAFGVEMNNVSSSNSGGPIGQDLSDLSSDGGFNDSDLEEEVLEDELEYTEREQWEDEEDLRQRRQEAMTDEQIARLFAKQQEFGIDGDDLVIDDGTYDADGVGDIAAARAGLADISNSGFGRSANRNGMRRRGKGGNGSVAFPDASALADTVEQYGENGFDIMDFDRPSLRQTKGGRKGGLPPEMENIEDDGLKQNLADTWENDRSKKRLKKAEREELRAQGMLGAAGRKGKADLSQKYQIGMTMTQIQDELRAFLQNDGQTSRPFPPMGKNDRKDLHELANALNLKSKSVSMGKDRFPVLYKTSLTVKYDSWSFDKTMSAWGKGWLNRDKKFGKGKKKAPAKVRPFGGAGGAAAGLRNGEVVGASAAEIGRDNFGHKLMERMGWSRGMALGKEGEGRLLPVEQVMRSGKAGLG